MASRKQSSIFLLLALLIVSLTINSSSAAECVGSGNISVYWGQHSDDATEGSLKEACDSGYYDIVILNQLIVYDDGSTPDLNLANHCGSSSNPCSNLESTIKHCQDLSIKVFLSIGEDLQKKKTRSVRHSIASSDQDVTKDLAKYLVENFFSGNPGPLGNVFLDGIDIADVTDSEHLHWDALVKAIKEYETERRIYLSASPQCVYEDYYLGPAIKTGLFDYIWVEFYYQNPCIYSNGNSANLLDAWNTWTSNVPKSLIFLGLTANKDLTGYITPDELESQILPNAKKASNYGGVMIWDRYYDRINHYTPQIKGSVPKSCRCVCDEPASNNFYSLLGRYLPM